MYFIWGGGPFNVHKPQLGALNNPCGDVTGKSGPLDYNGREDHKIYCGTSEKVRHTSWRVLAPSLKRFGRWASGEADSRWTEKKTKNDLVARYLF